MPVYRGPDGKIIEENTRTISSSQNANKSDENIDGKTRRLSSRPVPPTSSDEQAEDDLRKDISGVTKIYKASASSTISDASEREDPVVGWLVIIEGRGKGADFRLGFGANAIGRGEGESVSLNFGDKQISRTNHGVLTYDPKGRKFYIQGGGGRSLTYLNDEVVLSPTQLSDRSIIQVGETKLKFVSFCDDNFNWES
jgi:hypothetical protein